MSPQAQAYGAEKTFLAMSTFGSPIGPLADYIGGRRRPLTLGETPRMRE
jgi:hypothetical protein